MEYLRNYPFRDPRRAQIEMRALESSLPPETRTHLDLLLASSPAPEQALHRFTSLRERQPAAFARLSSTEALRYLVSVFAYSGFLSEELLEYPHWADELLAARDLDRVLTAEEVRARLEAELPKGIPAPLLLARFRRRQILRIVVRDVLGLGELAEITAELGAVAGAFGEVAY